MAFNSVAYSIQEPRNSVSKLYLRSTHYCSLRTYLRFYGSFKRTVSIPGCLFVLDVTAPTGQGPPQSRGL
jgi:hypothetical protein